MKEFTYTITDSTGIHARPAGLLIKKAGEFKSSITLTKGDKSANLKRLFAVMGLNVKCGDTVRITVNGEDEEEATSSVKEFFKNNL